MRIQCINCGYKNTDLPRRAFVLVKDNQYCFPCYKVEFTGECSCCYGKGYSSRMVAIKYGEQLQYQRMAIAFCSCKRGQDLKKLVEENYKPIA